MLAEGSPTEWYTTGRLAAAAGYSVQQVRDLERLDVIPPGERQPNGYRRFSTVHVTALRAYRGLAVAVGPVLARATMRELHRLPRDEAVATITALHVGLARSRADTVAALRALESIVDESAHDAPAAPEDSMSITDLSIALGVRSSTLRFWEDQGLIAPERVDGSGRRRYPPDAVRDARIVAALREGGYRIPAVREVMASVRGSGGGTDARAALQDRLQSITARSESLLRAGAGLVDLLDAVDRHRTAPPPPPPAPPRA